jgi:large subunit ribosomal protein L13
VIALGVLAVILLVQLLPAAIALIVYGAADGSGLLDQTAALMLAGGATGLVAVLSLYWITSTIIAMVIDATDQVVGRLCSKVAKLIRGKYKPTFTPHVDCGDNVIIINAAKAVFTGKKETDKVYTRYTGYPGGQRFNTPAELRKRPDGMDKIIRHAVKGMLPKGPLGRRLLDNLYIYDGTEHKHEAQQPKAIDINQYK